MTENFPDPNSEQLQKTSAPSSKTKKAFMLGGVGAFILVSSFGLTYFLSHHNQSFTFALYGLTSIGVILVFGSLVMFFE